MSSNTTTQVINLKFLASMDLSGLRRSMTKLISPATDAISSSYGGGGAAISRHTGRLMGSLGRAGTHAGQAGSFAGLNLDLERFALVVRQSSRVIAASTKALASMAGMSGMGRALGAGAGQKMLGAGAGISPMAGGDRLEWDIGGFQNLRDFQMRPTPPEIWEKASTAKDKYKTNLGKLKKKTKETTKETQNFVDKIISMTSRLRSISRLMFYASMDLQQFANVILGPLTQGVRVFADYDKILTQMWVNFEFISQSGDAAMSMLVDRFEELADVTEFSRSEIAQAAAVFGTANVAAQDISATLGELTDLARVNFMTMDQMATITLKTMRRFTMSLEEGTEQMWRLTAIAQRTGESIELVASQLGYASELGQELGYSFAEIAVQMTILTEVYGSASIAGRRLSGVYGKLIAKGEEYGVQLRDMNGEMLSSQDQIAGLADYLDLIAGPLEQNQYLMQLFGTTGAASARAIIDAFREGRYDEMMEDQSDETIDALQGISDVIQDKVYVSIQDLTATLSDFVSKLGESVIPALEILLPLISTLVADVGNWIRDNKDLAVSIAALAVGMTALATVMRVIGFSIEIFVAFITMIKGVGVAIGGLVGWANAGSVAVVGLGGAIGALLAPIVLIVVVVTFLVGIIVGLVAEAEKLGKVTVHLGKDLTFLGGVFKILEGVVKTVLGLLKLIAVIIVVIIGGIFLIGYAIGTLIVQFLDWIGVLKPIVFFLNILGDALDWVGSVLDDVADGLFDLLESFLPHSPTLSDRVRELGESLEDTLIPMKEVAFWSRRLTVSTGRMKAQMGLHVGQSTANALIAQGGTGGDTNIVQVDGAYIQDPAELAKFIVDETMTRKSSRGYRRTAY